MFRRRLSFVLVPALSMAVPSVQARVPVIDADQLARIDTTLRKAFPATLPGAVVWLVVGGKLVFKQAYGAADTKHNTPLRPDMPFRIGSITKQFTSAAVMKLAEEGRIGFSGQTLDLYLWITKDLQIEDFDSVIE